MFKEWRQAFIRKRLRWKWRRMLKERYDMPGGSLWYYRLKKACGFLVSLIGISIEWIRRS